MDVRDRPGFESGIAIANGRARTDHNDGDAAGVDEHLKALQNDETVPGRKAEIKKDQVGLLFTGGADGRHAIARAHDIESGSFEASGKCSELHDLVLDDHDFLAGHGEANLEKARKPLLCCAVAQRLLLRRLCVSNVDITREIESQSEGAKQESNGAKVERWAGSEVAGRANTNTGWGIVQSGAQRSSR